MSRATWKPLFLDSSLFQTSKQRKVIYKIWSRCSSIPGYLLGKRVYVYNGKTFKPLLITREHIGFKFGEFVLTRKHSSKSSKKKR